MASEGVEEYNSVIETLINMFSGVINKDAIVTVVESCGGDLNLSVEAIMNITSDGNTIPDQEKDNYENNGNPPKVEPFQGPQVVNPPFNQNLAPNTYSLAMKNPSPTTTNVAQPSTSYASPNNSAQQPPGDNSSFQKYGAVPKGKTKLSPLKVEWNDQIRRIIEHHNKGSRILIIMRGAPGSGKTHLAQKIVELVVGGTYMHFRTHICSTDDYFIVRGKYYFNKYNLSEAHAWNQNRARLAMQQGLSPIVIDNTNIEVWEMEPYARNGVQNGYILEVVEPNTTWAKRANQLARKNVHNVSITTIKRMLDNYQNDINGDSLLNYFNLTYPSDKIPPVLRSMPEFIPINPTPVAPLVAKPAIIQSAPDDTNNSTAVTLTTPADLQRGEQEVEFGGNDSQAVSSTIEQQNVIAPKVESHPIDLPEISDRENTEVESEYEIVQEFKTSMDPSNDDLEENTNVIDKYSEIEKKLQEIEKIEQEWENGEDWEENPLNRTVEEKKDQVNSPKPPRGESNTENNLIEVVNNIQDWQQISMFMPPWQDASMPNPDPVIPVETTTNGTCMELGDFDVTRNNFKVLSATPRDINFYYISSLKEKIPDKRMLDKSTMTNEHMLTEVSKRCLNEEKHFSALRKLFKNINKAALRDIFDQCMGDVNWAVEIVLDGVATNQIDTVDEEQFSDDDACDEMCTCLSTYHIVPDVSSAQAEANNKKDDLPASAATETTSMVPRKTGKREIQISDASVELKRQIEQNVVIADNHYSKHCLKIMRHRRGYAENDSNDKPSTSQLPSSANDDTTEIGSDDEDDSSASVEDVEKTVNITLGKDFITELDTLFGRTDMSYPDALVPKINMPISLLNEINALWMESLMHQIDEHERQRAKILQEDEDFAKALALKEAELALVGRVPEVLDFKEIMDMDLALSLYQRDVAEWRNKEPNDLAAKLTREKLYSLFPDVAKDILAELLMAHDNNFQSTVEVLLMSTGKANVLQEKDGVNKFVMKNEMERQAKILEEERKALSEVEWPLLPKGEVPDISVVNEYRDTADRHLHSRNMNIQKASTYLNRGMLTVAGYYRELADFHKLKFEQSNSLAAVSLMQIHASKSKDTATIDLHFFRVAEAKESMDLFIDTHIQKLRSNQGRGQKYHTLYFISGRGLHSNGKPRIKPAVKKRLRERDLICNEVNPGLLSTRVTAESLLSHEVA